MLRIHLLQQWYSLSDPAMEEALIEVPTMRRFAGIELISDRIPDETTILTFRHLLEKHELGEQWYFGMKVHIGVDSESGLIHSVETTAANVHYLTPVADLLHGDETVVYAGAGYQGIEKREEMQSRGIGFRIAMRPGKRRVLPDTPEGRLNDLIETVKAHFRAKGEHPFRVIKRQFGFQKTRLRGMLKNRYKVNVLAALSNLFMVRHELLCRT